MSFGLLNPNGGFTPQGSFSQLSSLAALGASPQGGLPQLPTVQSQAPVQPGQQPQAVNPQATALDYYDQIRGLRGQRGGGQSGNIGDYRLWDVNKNGNYLVMDQQNNPVFGSAGDLKSRSQVAQWLGEALSR